MEYLKGTSLSPSLLKQIFDLYDAGSTIDQISLELKVSSSAIRQRIKYREDPAGWEELRKKKNGTPLDHKIRNFLRTGNDVEAKFTSLDLLLVRKPKCYLTGRKINIEDPSSYQLDHRIPVSKGGSNSIDNCYFTTTTANQIKGAQTEEELLRFCFELLLVKLKDKVLGIFRGFL